MNRLLPIACFLISLLTLHVAADDWIELFNGKDLSGWHTNRAEGSFAVKDGLLVAIAKGQTESNSGIFIHTDYALRDDKGHLANGYEVNLNTSKNVKQKTGSLYDVVDLTEPPLDDTQWFETRIRVQGKRIQIWLDGKQVVDYLESENPIRKPNRKGRLLNPEGAAIALQAHDPDSLWQFKEIRIRRL